MNKTKTNFIILLAILIASVFSNNAIAQGHHHNKECMPGMCKGGKAMGFLTDLTADQQKQIDALKLTLVKDIINLKNQIEEKKAHIKTISYGDNVDMTAVNKAYDELFALKAEIAKKHAAFQQDVRKLLTSEQKVQFDIHQSKPKPKGHGMGMGDRNCKDKNGNGCCKDKATEGEGGDQMKGCQGHGQMDGMGKNCPKK